MDRRELGTQLLGRLKELRGQVLDRGGYRVLAYRRFWPPTPEIRKAFESQLDHLRENYVVRPLPEILQELRAGRAPGEGTICITVDGGHHDFFRVAYPALRARGMSATLFLPTRYLDGTEPWLWFDRIVYAIRNTAVTRFGLVLPDSSPDEETPTYPLDSSAARRTAAGQLTQRLRELPTIQRDEVLADVFEQLKVIVPVEPTAEFAALTWEDAGEMWPHNISFGVQGVTMDDEASMRMELTESKARIAEKLGDYDIPFCYPGAMFDERAERIGRALGYRGAVTNEPGRNTNTTNPFRILRIGAEPVADPMQFARLCAVLRR